MDSWCMACGRYELIGGHRSEPIPTEQIDRAYGLLVQAFWAAAAMQARELAKTLREGDR